MPSLQSINDDVLINVVTIVSQHDHPTLKSFSLTCRSLRAICMPHLFSHVVLRRGSIEYETDFVPPSIWPYVKQLVFTKFVATRSFTVQPNGPKLLKFNYYSGFSLPDALRRMPNLHTVSFPIGMGYSGFPWLALSAVLSTPHIRYVGTFNTPIIYKQDVDYPKQIQLESVARLSSLKITLPSYNDIEDDTPLDIDLLTVLASKTHASLEAIVLRSHTPLYKVLWQQNWPLLRSLTLGGPRRVLEDASGQTVPMISILAQMPKLLLLRLALYQPRALAPQAIWPPGFDAVFPWPELRILSISYPHPDDQIFDHLPPTLRRFELLCRPRHYLHLLWNDREAMRKLGLHSPILTSSEMRSILRRCQKGGPLTSVKVLDLEFEEDGVSELGVYRIIPSCFPNVAGLTIHRYRRTEDADSDAPVVPIAEALADLGSLEILFIHLDLKEMPHPFVVYTADHGEEAMRHFVAAARAAMGTFAETLAPSVRWLCFLMRDGVEVTWRAHRVVRDGLAPARAEPTPFVWRLELTTARCGFETYLEAGPSPCPVCWSLWTSKYDVLRADYNLSTARQ